MIGAARLAFRQRNPHAPADDLGFSQRGGTLFMAYLQGKERMAARSRGGTLGTLGLTGLP